ncbi:MAG: Transcriptional regulator, TetR family protein [Thermoleophilia bacterium]|nr:Transcriptional regulator, TetR family protein [Thermoleophilia bacterium]
MSTPDDSTSIWTRPEPGARRPRFTREQLASVALGVADTDGIDAVSMRRVARELGAGTMTLYHYVRTKDDLLALMQDALMAEVVVPADRFPDSWRAALAAIAHSSRDAFIEHPWAMAALEGVRLGPNAIRHFEQSLQALAATDLGWRDKLAITGIVDDYVFGYVMRAGEAGRDLERDVGGAAEIASIDAMLRQHFAPDELTNIRGWAGDDPVAAWRAANEAFTSDERFELGLEALLDGLAVRFDLPR